MSILAGEDASAAPLQDSNQVPFVPIVVRTSTVRQPIAPVAHDCMKLIVVRSGSAILLSELGEKPVGVGDVVVLGTNTLCGSEPEGSITVTTLYVDHDYVIDQLFWQHAALLPDRWHTFDFAKELYSEPAQILHLGEDRVRMLTPWLDELVALSIEGPFAERFFRLQALMFAVFDIVSPFIRATPRRLSSTQRRTTHLGAPRHRHFVPMRAEARAAARLLRKAPARQWSLDELAATVHLSPSQFGRVFVKAYGKAPMTYLAMLRAERLACLLREDDFPIDVAMHQVGWHSRGHAARMFRQAIGVTPTRYRQLSRQQATA